MIYRWLNATPEGEITGTASKAWRQPAA